MPTKKTVASKNPDKSTKNIKPSLPKSGEKKAILDKKKVSNSSNKPIIKRANRNIINYIKIGLNTMIRVLNKEKYINLLYSFEMIKNYSDKVKKL